MFSSMYVGSTGVVAHSTMIQVISNNLANVSTIGYKSSRTLFEDLMYQQEPQGGSRTQTGAVSTAGQVGKGVKVADIKIDFSTGPLEGGSYVTDLAIGGSGFFRVEDSQARAFYTRAGAFRFDREGVLRDPHGNILQGYQIDPETGALGGVTNIVLPTSTELDANGRSVTVFRSDPRATENVTMITNLDSGSLDNSTNAANPFFALGLSWDGTSNPPLAENSYAYHNAIRVYDAEGNAHTLNVYFDRVRDDISGSSPGGTKVWEYVVGIDPDKDGRSIVDSGARGLISMGTLTFNAAGNLIDQTAWVMDPAASNAGNLSNWSLAAMSTLGYPMCDVIFLASGTAMPTQSIGIDFGISNSNATWSVSNATTAASVGSNVGNLPSMDAMPRGALYTTSYDGSSVTLSQNQDGYATGYLEYLKVDKHGVLSGFFSNDQTEALYKVAIYDFTNEFGLRREGGNYFSETLASGKAIEGQADEAGLGVVYQNTLEQSNVDMATEFANLILGQRGFQANTKVITTADAMIQTLSQLKR